PGRRARCHLEAELARLGERDRHDTVLERAGRVERVVLDPELPQPELGGEAVGPDQRCEPGAEVDRAAVRCRQQVGVSPDGGRTGGDLLAADRAGDRLVVVDHLQRAEAELAHVERLGRVRARALTALETGDERHCSSSSIRALAPGLASPRWARPGLVAAVSLGPVPRPLWMGFATIVADPCDGWQTHWGGTQSPRAACGRVLVAPARRR